jgi:hypothetical protein
LYKAGAAPGVVGSAPQTGAIGQVLYFFATTNGNSADYAKTLLGTITPGTWSIALQYKHAANASVSQVLGGISTSSTAGTFTDAGAVGSSTGSNQFQFVTTNADYIVGYTLLPKTVTVNTDLYAALRTVGANTTADSMNVICTRIG